MMGGAQLMLKANDGLDPEVGKNTLQFRVNDFEEDLVLSGPGLNRKLPYLLYLIYICN